jgi:hypothetical protein
MPKHWRALCTSVSGLANRCAGILCLNEAKSADNAKALASIFNKVEVQKNKHVEHKPPAEVH